MPAVGYGQVSRLQNHLPEHAWIFVVSLLVLSWGAQSGQSTQAGFSSPEQWGRISCWQNFLKQLRLLLAPSAQECGAGSQ